MMMHVFGQMTTIEKKRERVNIYQTKVTLPIIQRDVLKNNNNNNNDRKIKFVIASML